MLLKTCGCFWLYQTQEVKCPLSARDTSLWQLVTIGCGPASLVILAAFSLSEIPLAGNTGTGFAIKAPSLWVELLGSRGVAEAFTAADKLCIAFWHAAAP